MFTVDPQGVAQLACYERRARFPRWAVTADRSMRRANAARFYLEQGENALVNGRSIEAELYFREARKLSQLSKAAAAKQLAQKRIEQDRKLSEAVFV